MFKIISTGWECARWIEQTVRSVDVQTRGDWEHYITYDPSSDDGGQLLFDLPWEPRRSVRVNGERKLAARNQWEAIQRAHPADDDIVVFLDLDGDMLAHPEVLDHLAGYYSDGTLLTYGNYEPVPFVDTCPPAVPFPPDVITANSYRQYIRSGGPCSFNHLRTMSGAIANRITPHMLQYADGTWYQGATDYAFMISGLEMAGWRHKCIEEVLLTYNEANPLADSIAQPEQVERCVQDMVHRFPLNPI